MEINGVLTWISCLFSFSLILQSFEMLYLLKKGKVQSLWNKQSLRAGSQTFGFKFLVNFIMNDSAFKFIVIGQIILASLMCYLPKWPLAAGLILLKSIELFRFRGIYNGGSDMMTMSVGLGLLLSLSSADMFWQKMGLFLICINVIYSYLKAGAIKLMNPDWRSGRALGVFLSRSIVKISPSFILFCKKKHVGFLLCWTVIIFELLLISVVFFPNFIWAYFFTAMGFHIIVFLFFGLNRFFWAWLAAWPAVYYCVQL